MVNVKVAKKTAKKVAKPRGKKKPRDDGETASSMEPLLIPSTSIRRPRLTELAFDLSKRAASFKASLPSGIVLALSELVRSMNCYYSNLIEGHNTHPFEIERALNDDLSTDGEKRNLQLEAKAHIAVQRWIDENGLTHPVTSTKSICEIHSRFIQALPDDLKWAKNPKTGRRIRVRPGEFRKWDVKVGHHIAISPGAVPRFMERYEHVFCGLEPFETVLSAAAAHHRLLWIHPFTDGNGRVARLVSYAMLREALETGGIWSIARGLARQETKYKNHLAACDMRRRNDLDGRGNLSEEALVEFSEFFLNTCLDQVAFMEDLATPEKLRARLINWAEEEVRLNGLPAKAPLLLDAILFRGSVPRKDVPTVLGLETRAARRVSAALQSRGIITAQTSRADWHIAFPATLAPRLMPGLFPVSQ